MRRTRRLIVAAVAVAALSGFAYGGSHFWPARPGQPVLVWFPAAADSADAITRVLTIDRRADFLAAQGETALVVRSVRGDFSRQLLAAGGLPLGLEPGSLICNALTQ